MASAPAPIVSGLWELFDLTILFRSGVQAYLDETLTRSAYWFHASGGSIFLLNVESGEHVLRSATGHQRHLPEGAKIVPGKGIAGIVLDAREPKIVDDPRLDPLFAAAGIQADKGFASAMILPLIGDEGKPAGVLNLSRQAGEPRFGVEDLALARTLADQVVLAVTNAQMVDELHTRVYAMNLMNEKLTAVLDSVAGAVVVVDADGAAVNHNRAATEASFLHDGNAADLSDIQTALKEATNETIQGQLPTKRQAHDRASDRTWLVEGVPLHSGGAVVTVKETTEIERQNREVARVKRLAEIGQMTAVVAHEIRNPLTGIRSAASMIRQEPEMTDEMVAMIEEEVLRLSRLCEDFLEFARPMQVDRAPTDVAALCKRVAKLLTPEFDLFKVSLRVEVAPDLPKISLDAGRVRQVVVNLLRNALQASAPGQQVVLSAWELGLAVEDEGIGMGDEQRANLFSPFFTTKSDGTGLGLSTVRKIVDAHGGSLEVSSEPGRGSRFEVRWEA